MIPAVPSATYRLQLTPQFDFDSAARLVPYLKSLGISHLYTSPFFHARSGSTHGYDIIDHSAFNPELGGESAFLRLSEALKSAGMGLIVDFVPNHMCVEGARNEWWWNVLEFGPNGVHASHFDIDWHASPGGRARVLLPILGRAYGECLVSGEIRLEYVDDCFCVVYFDHRFPIRPDCYGAILRTIVLHAGASQQPPGRRLLEIANDYAGRRNLSEAEARELKTKLADVEGAAAVIERGLAAFYVSSGPGAVRRLDRLLQRQHYRLASWRLAGSEINYRRFFDINALAALRAERPETFRELHRLVARLLAEGRLHGLRIDHIDGLFDPAAYCRDLQRLIRDNVKESAAVYVVVEKILGEGEELPPWPGVAGSTGYEWLNAISRVLLDRSGMDRLQQCWHSISPSAPPFGKILQEAKSLVLDTMFAAEFNVLAQLLTRIAGGHHSTCDFGANRMRIALRAFIIEFPVYRTYADDAGLSDTDRGVIDRTIQAVREQWVGPDASVLDFLQQVLTLDLIRRQSGHSEARMRRFVMKLQQLTGPVMAKALEDTALYRDHRLLALNEVGNKPNLPALTVSEFHDRVTARQAKWPHGLTATATHDTKRGEDARMRILAIAEIAGEWADAVAVWRQRNERHAEYSNGRRSPSHEHEYMLYQAMIGSWPLDAAPSTLKERLCEFAIKAAREGKRETSWLDPDSAYEEVMRRFVDRLLNLAESADFLQSFGPFAERCALLGALRSLSQVTLKAMMPGVPDFYQGTEFWDLSLVDPDNRRPVDFAARAGALTNLDDPVDWVDLRNHWRNGWLKLALTNRLLKVRRDYRALFLEGEYQPVEIDVQDFIAFKRTLGRNSIVVIAGRHFAGVTSGGRKWPGEADWRGTIGLPPGAIVGSLLHEQAASFRSTCRNIPLASLLGCLPVAVLQLNSTSL